MQDTSTAAPPSPPPASSGRPTVTDWIFLASMVVMLALVAWVGELSYHEGMKTEVTKRNGETWAQWFAETGTERFKDDFGLVSCIGGPNRPVASPADNTEATAGSATPDATPVAPPSRQWGECLKSLTTPPGALAGLRNPFDNDPLRIVAKCEPSDRSVIGGLMLEKLVPTPPGSPIPFVASPLVETDLIDAKLQIRVTVCDKGGYPIRVAEAEF